MPNISMYFRPYQAKFSIFLLKLKNGTTVTNKKLNIETFPCHISSYHHIYEIISEANRIIYNSLGSVFEITLHNSDPLGCKSVRYHYTWENIIRKLLLLYSINLTVQSAWFPHICPWLYLIECWITRWKSVKSKDLTFSISSLSLENRS